MNFKAALGAMAFVIATALPLGLPLLWMNAPVTPTDHLMLGGAWLLVAAVGVQTGVSSWQQLTRKRRPAVRRPRAARSGAR